MKVILWDNGIIQSDNHPAMELIRNAIDKTMELEEGLMCDWMLLIDPEDPTQRAVVTKIAQQNRMKVVEV